MSAACDNIADTANDQGVDIFVGLPTRMEVVLWRARMERVFINLITNALEAMPRGGTIRISASKAGGFALIAVEDSGPGIPPEIYCRLFAPFVTSGKKDGLGLGLALSRRTVRDHGGDMWIEPASGARFVIRLPLSRALPRVGHTTAKNLSALNLSGAGSPSTVNSVGQRKEHLHGSQRECGASVTGPVRDGPNRDGSHCNPEGRVVGTALRRDLAEERRSGC